MWEALSKLTPVQAQIYECRMSVTPPRKVKDVARLLGKSAKSIGNTWTKIRHTLGYDPLAEAKALGLTHRHGSPNADTAVDQLKTVSPEVLARRIEMAADRMLQHFSETKMENANLSELSRAVKDLLSMRQLLRGEPTQILSTAQRTKLSEMMPAFIKEAQRRGYEFQINPSTGEIATMKKVAGQKVPLIDIEAAAQAVKS